MLLGEVQIVTKKMTLLLIEPWFESSWDHPKNERRILNSLFHQIGDLIIPQHHLGILNVQDNVELFLSCPYPDPMAVTFH